MDKHASARHHHDHLRWMSLLFGTMLVLCLTLGSLHALIEFNDVMQNQARHPFSWLNATFNTGVAIFMPIVTYKGSPYPAPTKRWEKIVLKVYAPAPSCSTLPVQECVTAPKPSYMTRFVFSTKRA